MREVVMAYRYPLAARWLHWTTAALVAAMIVVGVWMMYFEPKDEDLKLALYDIHQSAGVVVFIVVLLRLLRRMANPPAPLPFSIPGGFRLSAYANHALLYAVLLIQPITGFLETNAYGFPLHWARLVEIPSPIGEDKALAPILSDLHWGGAVLLVVLIGAHICGAFYHGVIRRDGVVQRML
jgi:cytochrome b561